jgi:hypothetical protein
LAADDTSALIQREAVGAAISCWQVYKLTGDSDFRCLDRDKGADEGILDDRKCSIASRVGKVAQLPSFGKDLLASPDIDDEGYGDDNPDGAIEGSDTEEVPFSADPTPQLK